MRSVRTLEHLYRTGADVEHYLPVLATYLGHVDVVSMQGAVGDGNGLSTITVNGGTNTSGVNAYIGPTLATGGTPETDAVNAYSFTLNTNTLYITGALTIAAARQTALSIRPWPARRSTAISGQREPRTLEQRSR